MSSDGTRNTTSPGTRMGSRLVARIVSWGAARRSASAARAGEREQPRAVKQRLQLPELAVAAHERARVCRQRPERLDTHRSEAGELCFERGRQLGQLVAPLGCPVLVAVLRQQLAAVERER